MVLRAADRPSSFTDQIKELAAGQEEQVRGASRGASAIRDSGGNIIEMNGASPFPLMTPVGKDSALAFTPDGRVSVTSEDGTAYRDFRARTINATESIGTDNNLVALNNGIIGNLLTARQITCDTNINAAGSVGADGNVVAVGNLIGGAVRSFGNINADISIAAGQNVLDRYGNVRTPASDVRLKEDFADVDDADLEQLAAAPVQSWRFIDEEPRRIGPVAQDLPDSLVTENDDGTLGLDVGSYLGGLLALIQRQAARIDALETRLSGSPGAAPAIGPA